MLDENNKEELQKISGMNIFTASEVELINFIINKGRLPNYVDERREYQILLRLNKKLKMAKEKVLVLSGLFGVLDRIKVSNKLVERGVD